MTTYDPLTMVAAYRNSSDKTTKIAGDNKLNEMLDEMVDGQSQQ